MKNCTRNEILDYFKANKIEYIKIKGGNVRIAEAFAKSLNKLYNGNIIQIYIAKESEYTNIHSMLYKIKINNTVYKNKTRSQISDILYSFNQDYLYFNNSKKLSVKHFINTISKYYKQCKKLEIIIG